MCHARAQGGFAKAAKTAFEHKTCRLGKRLNEHAQLRVFLPGVSLAPHPATGLRPLSVGVGPDLSRRPPGVMDDCGKSW